MLPWKQSETEKKKADGPKAKIFVYAFHFQDARFVAKGLHACGNLCHFRQKAVVSSGDAENV